jgi:hypothetical protein
MATVSSSGATVENDDLVKDLENWFADHQQMCRLMMISSPQDMRELASTFERLHASVVSGQRLFGRLKTSVNAPDSKGSSLSSKAGRIPLSGMNRFDESKPVSAAPIPASSWQPAHGSSSAQAATATGVPVSLVSLSSAGAHDTPRLLPSRTYLKKSGGSE